MTGISDVIRAAGRARRCVSALLMLTAAGLLGTAAPAAAAGGSSCAGASATPQQIYGCLNLPAAPADYVVLIDTSGSMQGSGRYAGVLQDLPGLLTSLGATAGSRVALDTFDAGVFVARPLGPVGDPNSYTAALPPSANGVHTDFGIALNLAYQQLSNTPASFGAVILLSDGQLDASPGSPYAAYGNQAWRKLHDEYAALNARMPVNGYGIELTPQTDLSSVLGQVFPNPVAVKASAASLSDALRQARDDVQKNQAAAAIQKSDSGAGVTARLTAADGSRLGGIDLGAGQATIRLSLTSSAAHIPLTVSNLRIAVAGFPIQARLDSTSVTLAPAGSATVLAHLSWTAPTAKGLFSGTLSSRVGMTVTGQVASPWAQTIRGEIGDSSFTVGNLSGGASTVEVTRHKVISWWLWLLYIAIVLAALAVVAGLFRYWLRRPPLRGSVTVMGVDNRLLGRVELSGRVVRINGASLRNMPAVATIRGVRSGLRWDGIELTCTRTDSGTDSETRQLRSGDERVLRGIRFTYEETPEARRQPASTGPRNRR